jgi:DNA-binding NarL/FixJ family response regulator
MHSREQARRRVPKELEEEEMVRLLVVDDRVDFRMAFVGLLEGQSDLEVVGQAGSLAEARKMLEGVDVALLDRGLPDGLELMGLLRVANPDARVLVMSSTGDMSHPGDAIRAGADGIKTSWMPPSGCSRRYGARRGRAPMSPANFAQTAF